MISNAWRRVMLICGVALLFVAPVWAAQDEKVSLNFVNADIPEVIRAVSTMTGKNFLVDPRVKGTINIVSATPISAPLAYDILLSALRLQGFTAVESNGATKVMPEADAKLYVGSVNDGKSSEDKLVTRVYVLKYESASQLVSVLRPLIAPNNVVVAYPSSNALVVTDYASNLKRIEQIVDAIDRPGGEDPVIIPVKHTSAVDLAQTVNRLMQDGASGAAGQVLAMTDSNARFILLADARTNNLLVRTDNPVRLDRVHELVKQLDVYSGATGNMHVVYLKNAEATKVAQTLRAVMAGDTSAAPSAAPGASAAPVMSGGMVQADQSSNALIITAPEATYNNLRAVVDMLDVRRAQVYVEALIAEVTADKVANFGIQWQSLSGAGSLTGNAKVIGGTSLVARGAGGNIIDAAANLGTVSQGLNIGVVKGQATIPGLGTVLNLGVLANALETNANANILSTPNLLTLDNEEAKIVIGQNVPFITGQYAQTGSATTATPFQTIERKDVGLTLRIKPQISEGGTVKLQIYQEVSSVQAQSVNNAAGLITNKRSLESSVLVDDGQIVVLGGLIQDTVNEGQSKVPLLGSIPLLGYLFRYDTREHAKTNLMVFIWPHIIRADEAARGLTQNRYEYLRGEEVRSQPSWHLVLPSMSAPQLPPLQDKDKKRTEDNPANAASGVGAAPTLDAKQPTLAANPDANGAGSTPAQPAENPGKPAIGPSPAP